MAKVRFGKYSMELPGNRIVRLALGVLLVFLGLFFGWLPILGYWMVPVGFLILAADMPVIRRFNRRITVRIVGWWNSRKTKEERKAARNGNGQRSPAKRHTG